MFSRRERLSRSEFPTALSLGRRISSPHFTIVIPKEGQGYAVIVSKKIARLSVTRHAMKRRVFAALRTLSLPSSLIVFPKSSVKDASYQDIKTDLTNLLSKIR